MLGIGTCRVFIYWLQLYFFNRFLALKNLATVFLQQGPAFHENALCCYLQAVEIDAKDSVVWNQLGTLSCSMGLLSTSRWAFEQGLFCSPNNCKHFLSLLVLVYLEQASLFEVLEVMFFPFGQCMQGIAWKNYWKY